MRKRRATLAAAAIALGAAVLVAGTASAAQPRQAMVKRHSEAVTVQDIEIPVPGQQPVLAYLVRPDRPADKRTLAGILYLHWFEPGQSTQNRGEFLAEAIQLAGEGAVAVLPQLTFPWEGDPVGDATDRSKVTAQLTAITRAYQTLVAQPGVDPHRTAVVGHDYGSMYGAILAQREHGVRAEVFMAGDATWANWFDTYWLGLPDDQAAAYRALFAGLDPVDNVSRLGSHLLFQWAGRDPFVPAPTRDAFAAANPAATATLYPTADHFLNEQARQDRLGWLAGQLGLS